MISGRMEHQKQAWMDEHPHWVDLPVDQERSDTSATYHLSKLYQ